MDFFKSACAADPDPSPSGSPRQKSPPDSPRRPPDEEEERGGEVPATGSPDANSATSEAWSFGGLIKTVSWKEEFRSLIETYRRDLAEFGSGLKKETAAIREVATRAVRDLPGFLDSGTSVAHESLESVGQAVDDIGDSLWRGTVEIISQSKEAFLAMESDANSSDMSSMDIGTQNPAGSWRRYNMFEAQVLAIQSDPSAFSDEPEDPEDFKQWISGFHLAEKEEEIENLCFENGALEGFLEKLVPTVVDYDTFWSRYYYKIHKVKQVEDARVKLVERVISREEDEDDLSWKIDDEEEEEEKKEDGKEDKKDEKLRMPEEKKAAEVEENKDEAEKEIKKEAITTSEWPEEKEPVKVSQDENLGASVAVAEREAPSIVEKEEIVGSNREELNSEEDDNTVPEAMAESAGSCKDSDVSVVSMPSTPEEDDLGWVEIEDLGEFDDKKINISSTSSFKLDLYKRLSTAEDDEDLSWDIEDDDEPANP